MEVFKVRRRVAEILAGRGVLCALSGGVDSVALLHLLKAAGVRVVAAHVEHGIRGESSMRDCAFVQRLCEQWEVSLVVAHVDVPAEAKRRGRGIEETARDMRYGFLRQQLRALSLDCIVTAHHANDQAETVLMHLIRGASPAGLAGMAAEAGDVVRPLLEFSREEILRYAEENHLTWVEDETNADTAYLRNAVRHELMPLLERYNPRVVEALGRLARLSAAQSGYLKGEASRVLAERQRGGFLGEVGDLPEGLRQCVLHGYLTSLTVDAASADVERVEALYGLPAGRRATVGAITLERNADGVRVVERAQAGCRELRMGRNETPWGVFTLSVEEVPHDLNLGKCAQALDAEAVRLPLVVRSRCDGDRVRLLGHKGHTLVSDVLIDRKVPRALRDGIPLVADAEGNILWIAGIAPCETGKVSKGSRRALILRYSKA